MAILEKLCWEVLDLAYGKSVSRSHFMGHKIDDPPVQNAMPLAEIESDLVLRYSKDQIEDSLHFLEKRGYLIKYGTSRFSGVVMWLSDSALEAHKSRKFSEVEQQVFKEALVDYKKPGWLGIKLNLEEICRRAKKKKK